MPYNSLFDSPRFLTAKEVATLLKLNILTVYEYIRRGSLPVVKLGRSYRVESSDLDNFIKGQKQFVKKL